MDTYRLPWGPMGDLSHSSQFSRFSPLSIPWKVSVVASGEQHVTIEQRDVVVLRCCPLSIGVLGAALAQVLQGALVLLVW